MRPDVIKMTVEEGGVLVIATDGFWGELDAAEQVALFGGP